MGGRDPVQGGFDLAAIGGVAAPSGWVVRAAQLDDLATVVFDHFGTGDEIGVAQADFAARGEAKELARRVFHKVFALNVEVPRKGDEARAGAFVFWVVDGR